MNDTKNKASPRGASKKRCGVRINKPADLRRLLTKGINGVLRDDLPCEKLRAIAYASQTILRIFELELTERRLDKLEALLSRAGLTLELKQ